MIFSTAGILGVDPWPYQLWELLLMREGREKEHWDRLAFQLTNIAGFAGAKKPKFSDYHKFAEDERKLTKAKMSSLKSMFPRQETSNEERPLDKTEDD